MFETWTNRPHWDVVAHRTVLRAALSLHSNPTPCVPALIDTTERRATATATAAGPATGCAIHHRPPPACLPHHQTPPSARRASVKLLCFFFFRNKRHGKTSPAATRQTLINVCAPARSVPPAGRRCGLGWRVEVSWEFHPRPPRSTPPARPPADNKPKQQRNIFILLISS